MVVREDPEGPHTGFTGVGKTQREIRYDIVAEIPPTGKVARATQVDETVGELEVNGHPVPLITSRYGEPVDLPEPEEETYYIVSILTAQAAKAAGRRTDDLLVSSDPVRDAQGKIVGVMKFAIV